jgi:hypothetical protein
LIAALSACALAVPAWAGGGDVGFRGPSTGPVGSELTSSKPQSKLWFNDRGWWASMFDPTSKHFHIFRLDRGSATWIDTGVTADPLPNTRSDVLWDPAAGAAGKLYIASHKLSPAAETAHQPDIPNPPPSTRPGELFRYSYDSAAGTYVPDAGFPVEICPVDVEALVIAKDSAGRLWATWTAGDQVWVRHTTGSDASWSAPYVIPGAGTTLTPDDLSSIVSFGVGAGRRIGVLWSNQVDGHFYFATHTDGAGDAAADWSVETVPYSEFADDHINLKTDSAGRIYAAVKSGATAAGAPSVSVLVRSPAGAWVEHTLWQVKDHATRPTMLLDEQQHFVEVYATGPLPDDPSNIDGMLYSKTASTDTLAFPDGAGTPLMRDMTSGGEVHDATSTKQNVDRNSGVVVLGSNEIAGTYWFTDSLAGTTPKGGGSPGAGQPPAGAQPGATSTTGTPTSIATGVPTVHTPPAPPASAATFSRLVVARAQRGPIVRGRLTVGYAGSVVRVSLVQAHGRGPAAARSVVHHSLEPGVVHFSLRLAPRARTTLARLHRVVVVLRVTVTRPGSRAVRATRQVVVRGRSR